MSNQLPLPPGRTTPAAVAGQGAGQALPLPPPPSIKPTQAPKFADIDRAYVKPAGQRRPAKRTFPNDEVDSPSSAGAAADAGAEHEIALLDIVEDRGPRRGLPPTPVQRLAASLPLEADTAAALPATTAAASPGLLNGPASVVAIVSKPSQSFDGKQSFISLEVDEAPVSGAPSVDQPSSAATKPDPQLAGMEGQDGQAVSQAQQAQPMDLDAPSTSEPAVPEQPETQPPAVLGTAAAAADLAAATAAADEADKRDIRPDLFASASRPSSAASHVNSVAKPSDAETGPKLLAAPKSKTTAKGNIQIVLATKHKQVLPVCVFTKLQSLPALLALV